MSKKNVRDKVIKDQLGSAMKLRIVAREVLWGLVEAAVQLNPVEMEEKDPESESQKEFTMNEMLSFGIVTEELPIEFGSNKSNNKRKKQQKSNQNKRNKVFSANSLPVFPYDGRMMEHNIYRLSRTVNNSTSTTDTTTKDTQYVRILGNGSKLHTSRVQILNHPDHVFEVDRFSGDLLELSASEKDTISELVEEDITLRFEAGCPPGVHLKYWDQRYRFLSKYDEGASLDCESWYSITAEPIARHITQRCVQEYLAKSKKQPIITTAPENIVTTDTTDTTLDPSNPTITSSENNNSTAPAPVAPAASNGISVSSILDCFSGCGGNTIPFAYSNRVTRVVSVDFDQIKLDNLRHNASIYGCSSKISTHCGDVYKYLEGFLTGEVLMGLQIKLEKYYEKHPKNTIIPLKSGELVVKSKGHMRFDEEKEVKEEVEEGVTVTDNNTTAQPLAKDFSNHVQIDHDHTLPDLIVMSPPWGGPDYCNNNVTFDLSTMLPCGDGIYLALLATTVCPNLVYLLPKNVDDAQIFALQKLVNKPVFIENIYLNGGCKVKCVYFGPLFKK